MSIETLWSDRNRVLVAPSLLSADPLCLIEGVQAAEAAGADLLHIDIMDGHFVPNLSFAPAVVQRIREESALPMEVHLMVTRPEQLAYAFMDAGADILIFHRETTHHCHRLLGEIQAYGVLSGLAFNPGEAVGELKYLREVLDMVLIMGVNPGFSGARFIGGTVDKVREVAGLVADTAIRIGVDGGVSAENGGCLRDAGASVLVSGSSFFSSSDPKAFLEELRG